MNLEFFSLTVTRRPTPVRPRVLAYLLTLPVTLFVSNLFLFYPFSQNFSFQNSLNSKNKKLFVCHQETFFSKNFTNRNF